MIRRERNKTLLIVESSKYQVETIGSRECIKLDKIVGLDGYALFHSIAGSSISFDVVVSAVGVQVRCRVRLILEEINDVK